MTTSRDAPQWIRVGAPDGETAVALEQRLAHLHPSAVGRGDVWYVEIEDFDDRGAEIEAAVRHWLDQIGVRSTVLTSDGEERVIVGSATRTAEFIPDYESTPALEHEP